MTRRRRISTRTTVRWSFNIPADLATILDNASWNPTLNKPRYGSRQELVETLLRKYVEEHNLASLPIAY